MIDFRLLEKLNKGGRQERLAALKAAVETADFPAADERMINNHIHTTYSFSPYSPSAAVYAARAEGLCTAGIVDHDSLGGAREFIEAGEMAGIPTTIGVETRVSFGSTGFFDRRINHPDQIGVAYMVMHGIPHKNIERVQAYFAPLRERRNERNRKMVDRINALYKDRGIVVDFDRDVLPLSEYRDGGTVTERHLMMALAGKMTGRRMPANLEEMLEVYDLVGRLKKECIPRIFVEADEECPDLEGYAAFSKEVGGILAYAYLGDVTVSVTGDKVAQKFEDDNLEALFATLDSAGVRAVTYMPTRNTHAQLTRLRALCRKYEMMEISGEDINSPRQSFVIEKMKEEGFRHLIDSTWSIIEHEKGGDV